MPKSPLSDVEIPEVSLHDALLNVMQTHEGKTALIDGVTGKEYKYADTIRHIRSVASGLYRLGVRKGDVLAIYSPNNPEYAFMLYGAMAAGASVTTINPAYTAYEVTHHLRDSGAQWVYCLKELSQTVIEATKSSNNVKQIIQLGGTKDCVPFQQLIDDDGSSFPDVKINPKEDVATIPYSSGTTGLPKGVMTTHYNIMANLIQRSHSDFMDPTLDTEASNVILGFLPFFHVYGLVVVLTGSLMGGRTIVTMPRFEPHLFLSSIEKYKVARLHLVPPIVVFMAKNPMVKNYDLSSIKRVHSGAAPLAPDVEAQFKTQINIKELRQGFGMTETTCGASTQPMTKPLRPGSSGVPLPNSEIQVVNIETAEVMGPNKEGELWVRGPNVMKGYLNRPEATRSTLDEDGWLHTGDVGYYDEDCYFYIVDRIKELIKFKGFQSPVMYVIIPDVNQVAPAELEALLLTHPKVADAGVIGIPDSAAGELPRAYVALKDNIQATQDEIKRFVAERLAHFKHLRGGVEFVKFIPKSPSGKILRKELRALANKSKM